MQLVSQEEKDLDPQEQRLEEIILTAMPEMTLSDIEKNIEAITKNVMEQRIRIGALLIQGKKLLAYDLKKFYDWAKEKFGIQPRTAREYMLFGLYGYANIQEAKELTSAQFRSLIQLSNEVDKKVFDDYRLEGRPVKDWSAKELEGYKVKMEAEKKALKMGLKEEKARIDKLDKDIHDGRDRLSDLEKENYDLKNPKVLNEAQFKRAQELIDDAVLSIRRAINIEIEAEHVPTLLSPITVAMTDLQKAWSPQWENLQE